MRTAYAKLRLATLYTLMIAADKTLTNYKHQYHARTILQRVNSPYFVQRTAMPRGWCGIFDHDQRRPPPRSLLRDTPCRPPPPSMRMTSPSSAPRSIGCPATCPNRRPRGSSSVARLILCAEAPPNIPGTLPLRPEREWAASKASSSPATGGPLTIRRLDTCSASAKSW